MSQKERLREAAEQRPIAVIWTVIAVAMVVAVFNNALLGWKIVATVLLLGLAYLVLIEGAGLILHALEFPVVAGLVLVAAAKWTIGTTVEQWVPSEHIFQGAIILVGLLAITAVLDVMLIRGWRNAIAWLALAAAWPLLFMGKGWAVGPYEGAHFGVLPLAVIMATIPWWTASHALKEARKPKPKRRPDKPTDPLEGIDDVEALP